MIREFEPKMLRNYSPEIGWKALNEGSALLGLGESPFTDEEFSGGEEVSMVLAEISERDYP